MANLEKATEYIGRWLADGGEVRLGDDAFRDAVHHVGKPVYVVDDDGRLGIGSGGSISTCDAMEGGGESYPLKAFVPPVLPQNLGDAGFCEDHGLRYAYVAGAMANGITSAEMVEVMGRAGMLGFYGAAGLELDQVEQAIDRIQKNLGSLPYGFNLIHSPNDPALEAAVVDLYLGRGVTLVSASAFLGLTKPLVKYRVTGIHRDDTGQIVVPNKVVAKVSRVEVARKFFSPAPDEILKALVDEGSITPEQAQLAKEVPVAQDLTAEADSGGHTDNRPALTVLPTILALRDEMQREHAYSCRLRVGAAGGIATPSSTAAAFAMGAAYVLTGTVNQACVEAGTSSVVREMLAQARQADVIMAPAADMFEMGVKVQVLKWGTMFAVRGRKLYDLYREYNSLDELPADQRKVLERDYFRTSLEDAWESARKFFEKRDPSQNERAERDKKHKMALVFRAYLGQASGWANSGDLTRKADYQIWCGPAIGAFNEWTSGTFLASPERRDVVTVAMNLLVGAAAMSRANCLRMQGITLAGSAESFAPCELAELSKLTAA